MLITIGKATYVAGLNWVELGGATVRERRKVLAARIKEDRPLGYVACETSVRSQIGILQSDLASIGKPAAATVVTESLSLRGKNGVVVAECADGKWWIVGFSHGSVVSGSGSDSVVEPRNVLEMLNRLNDAFGPEDQLVVYLCGEVDRLAPYWPDLADLIATGNVTPRPFAEFLADSRPKKVKAGRSNSSARWGLYAAFGVCAAAIWAYGEYRAAIEARAKREIEGEYDPETMARLRAEAAVVAVQKSLQGSLSSTDPGALAYECSRVLGVGLAVAGGWDYADGLCTKQKGVLRYRAAITSTVADLSRQVNVGRVTFPTATSAVWTIPVTSSGRPIPEFARAPLGKGDVEGLKKMISRLPTFDDVQANWVSGFRRSVASVGGVISVSAVTPVKVMIVKPSRRSGRPVMEAVDRSLSYQTFTVEVRCPLLSVLSSAIKSESVVTLDELSLANNGDSPMWRTKFAVFIQ